jgi:GPH family glycoside/pentoside/hexuronide:cation symporter
MFTSPDLSMTGKIIYAYTTYIIFTLVYTANNIPYGALMGVMTGDDKERTSIGSYRMAGAFAGGMLVQGALLYLVVMFGNINPNVSVTPIEDGKHEVVVSSSQNFKNVNINTKDGIVLFRWNDASATDTIATPSKSFSMESDIPYSFIVTGENVLEASQISVIDQQKGYSKSIYALSVVMVLCLFITFYYTRERVKPPKNQEENLWRDLLDLIRNKPWLIVLVVGLLFNVYNAIKQGILVIYFVHYIHNQLLAASYMVCLMLASIGGAMAATRRSLRFGKKTLFIAALLFSGLVNALIYFCSPHDITAIFAIGIVSEFAAAIFPTLFFVMLGDAADYSEYVNGRRATGLVYSAGSLATKFGGGVAGLIIGAVLTYFGYESGNAISIQGAKEGIVMLMSWVPTIVAVITAGFMTLYPLNQKKMDEITSQLAERRLKAN